MKKIYQTQRLILKTLESDDVDMVLNYYKQNNLFLERWEQKKTKEYFTINHQRKALLTDQEEMKKGNAFVLWIFKKETEKIIGSIRFNNIIRGPFQSCFLSYKLSHDEINNGYMTEALQKAIDIAFKELKLHRIEANIMPHNEASLTVVKKCNFQYEGLAVDYLKINGKWEDHIHMVLLNKEE